MWKGQLSPDKELENLEFVDIPPKLGVPVFSGHKADIAAFSGRNAAFDRHINRSAVVSDGYEDQCSPKHYLDLFNVALSSRPERLIDVGVYLGGSSVILAGVAMEMKATLDLIDINHASLLATYERIRRIYPEISGKVRMFQGTFPNYVINVMKNENLRTFVHFDGAHEFYDVVNDLSSLYYVRGQVAGIAIQDTHLRGAQCRNFVDAAVAAVFGFDVHYKGIGAKFSPDDKTMTEPNQYQGNYMLPNRWEGMFIPMEEANFLYPHPKMTIEELLAPKK